MNQARHGDQNEYQAAIIEYGNYFQKVAKSYGSLYSHPFDLAQFFFKIEKILKDMEEPQQPEPLSSREESIRCVANEIFLYDPVKNPHLRCALHLIQDEQRSSEYSQLDAVKDISTLSSEVLSQAMNLGKRVSLL